MIADHLVIDHLTTTRDHGIETVSLLTDHPPGRMEGRLVTTVHHQPDTDHETTVAADHPTPLTDILIMGTQDIIGLIVVLHINETVAHHLRGQGSPSDMKVGAGIAARYLVREILINTDILIVVEERTTPGLRIQRDNLVEKKAAKEMATGAIQMVNTRVLMVIERKIYSTLMMSTNGWK